MVGDPCVNSDPLAVCQLVTRGRASTMVRAAAMGPRGPRAAATARAPGTTKILNFEVFWPLGLEASFQLQSRGEDNALEFYSDEFLLVT